MNWKYASVGVLPGITLDSCEAQQKSQSTDVRVAVIQLACAVGAGELFPGHVQVLPSLTIKNSGALFPIYELEYDPIEIGLWCSHGSSLLSRLVWAGLLSMVGAG
jgi:hypothetical protein